MSPSGSPVSIRCRNEAPILIAACVAVALLLAGCSRSTDESPAQLKAAAEGAAAASAAASAAPSTTTPRAAPSSSSALGGEPCGDLGCRRYPSAALAVSDLLRLSPEIIAFGEAHALKGHDPRIPTSTQRFEEELLPVLAQAGAGHLVLELPKPSSGCEQAVEQTRKEQRAITEAQAPQNQNRFVSLGKAARRLNIVPYLLTPTCQQYEQIAKAGPDAIVSMLELISAQSERQLLSLWRKMSGQGRRLILAYGGAMHNDVLSSTPGRASPTDPRAAFSFGADLKRETQGRYLAVDLIVPEFISETQVWRDLAWYKHFDKQQLRRSATLFQTGAESYVIIFPHSSTER